jgi:hypothetical protein
MYLVEIDDQERESEATRHLLSNLFHRRNLLGPLGMDTLTWVVMEAQKPHLIPGVVGDVDILAGNLEFKDPELFLRELRLAEARWPDWDLASLQDYACKGVTEANGLQWPPRPSRVIGVEVQCGYFDVNEGPKSTKASRQKVEGKRGQIDRLLEIGLDMVALTDVIVNSPMGGSGSDAWMAAAGRAHDSLRAFQAIIEGRLPDDTSAAQFVWSVAGVPGGDERLKGAGGIRQVRPGLPNPLLASADAKALNKRAVLIEKVSELLATIPAPRYCPVVFIDCRKCRRLHYLDQGECCAAA